ncbi:MAG: hypothetical protein ACK5BV_03370, partial [Bacteroidota bacterium]
MVKKFFGILLVVAGIGNLIQNFGKSSMGRSDAGEDIGYGIFFLGLGFFLLTWNPKKEDSN